MKLYTLKSKLLEIETLAPKVYFLKFEKPEGFEYTPGQYIGITTHPIHRRSYSIFDHDDKTLSFVIDTKPAGLASQYFDTAKVGDVKFILGPYGKFAYQKTNNKKVFISTGTGMAPFLPMVKELREQMQDVPIDFIFGARYLETEVAYRYFSKFIDAKFKYIRCVTRLNESISDGSDAPDVVTYAKRITDVLPELGYDFETTEFYVCGGPQLVEDVVNVLLKLGADKIYFEKY